MLARERPVRVLERLVPAPAQVPPEQARAPRVPRPELVPVLQRLVPPR